MTNTQKPELLPCPFCGCDRIIERKYSCDHIDGIYDMYTVSCRRCCATVEFPNIESSRNRWNKRADGMISVKDRLPENGVPVIVSGGLAMRKTGGEWFTGMEEPLYMRKIEWEVTHWMPLPAPPKVDD